MALKRSYSIVFWQFFTVFNCFWPFLTLLTIFYCISYTYERIDCWPYAVFFKLKPIQEIKQCWHVYFYWKKDKCPGAKLLKNINFTNFLTKLVKLNVFYTYSFSLCTSFANWGKVHFIENIKKKSKVIWQYLWYDLILYWWLMISMQQVS